ncbi:MAG: division/cell wall cluster transcriptional repressor MraZ [Flavobacteriales bacterium]|nr:division/cell wall cluster transcriptional repressor MraZ [Flavobacteriales bacterium]
MTGFIGEYHCKLDVKGRLLIPSDMRKQLSPEDQGQFVISRGVDDCLSMYTSSEWGVVMSKLRKLNRFKAKDRKFARMFQKGATKVIADGSGRVLLPKDLLGWASIKKEVVVVANVDLWEIWDKQSYEKIMNNDWDEFDTLAADVMGDSSDEE